MPSKIIPTFAQNYSVMSSFENLNLTKPQLTAINELGLENPTPIQEESFPVVMSGKDLVGIAQTGTGKTFAYLLPILRDLKFSDKTHPRVLVMVPTRELVLQLVQEIEKLTKFMNIRSLGVYGGANINKQKEAVVRGCDILVATPGRLYDLTLSGVLSLKSIKKLVIDEVDVMLDAGFRYQLKNIFEILPERRQNLMFSATMTEEVDELIETFFTAPEKISIAVSGTPLDNIAQQSYAVQNFYTKVNLLTYILSDKEEFSKVLVFVASKKIADRLHEALGETMGSEVCVIHSNKAQNYRIRSIKQFDAGTNRVLVSTDVMARGLDLDRISHVINFDTPAYPENYMHRIGRTGRAEEEGKTILFYTEKEREDKEAIEALMDYQIPQLQFPEEVEVSYQLIPEERTKIAESNYNRNTRLETPDGGFHEKKLKNTKTNQGGSYLRKMKTYKKPKTKGDKNFNRRNKK
jgi:ATP-dependent RNA helicase RhlE